MCSGHRQVGRESLFQTRTLQFLLYSLLPGASKPAFPREVRAPSIIQRPENASESQQDSRLKKGRAPSAAWKHTGKPCQGPKQRPRLGMACWPPGPAVVSHLPLRQTIRDCQEKQNCLKGLPSHSFGQGPNRLRPVCRDAKSVWRVAAQQVSLCILYVRSSPVLPRCTGSSRC